ncbi:MAG: hypothetical protein K9K66_07730 [Desulfarculaceae bacterium]|nr:hypothetical protein [Desulfarculaceae bacterium]MCF8072015.1 hypothetical protein [Desulfarculaceae bacterium]MCF8101532.1 hypothetical protein [Desulfarculaceae bacterium]MCF8115082.1 hypothetical protein [Desulfarculaceae bacterium]
MRRCLTVLLLLLLAAPSVWAAAPKITVIAPSPELAAHVRQETVKATPRLTAWTGAAPPELTIEVAPTRKAFARRAADLGGPSWAAGLAAPRQRFILLRSPRQLASALSFREVLLHELAHLYLAAGLKGRHAPLWLEEGLAMQLSGEAGWGLAAAMTRAVLGPGLLPLSSLEKRFPPSAERASLAYAQSYYLVGWLLNKYGEKALSEVVRSLSQGRPLTAALQRATGHSLAVLEENFSQDMGSRFSWISALTAGGVLWALIALVAGVGLVVRRRKQRASWLNRDVYGNREALPRPRRSTRNAEAALREAGMGRRRPRGADQPPGSG